MIRTFRLLSPENCKKVLDEVSKIDSEDGRDTAGPFVKELKNNRQITKKTEAGRNLLFAIEKQLLMSNFFRVYTYVRVIPRTMINIHGPGQFYGQHVDNTWIMGGQPFSNSRADISFTLFLKDPDEYSGGELSVIDGQNSSDIKLQAGKMVVYDSGSLHQVKPVTEGTRICCVGWIQSWIRDPKMRTLISDLDLQIGRLKKYDNVPREEFDELHRIYNDLLRANMN
tara:strand:+ start:77 stop:754 length:678 start_codon:yes stop_codon:yes gene_type:complete